MKLIVGLGNPGTMYAHTRHNIGFDVVETLARSLRIQLKKDRVTCCVSGSVRRRVPRAGEWSGGLVIAQPQTYMNLSGDAVKALVRTHKVQPHNMLIVCDDLDLAFGRLKIKPSGGAGGHRGLASVIEAAGGSGIARLRVGIGRPPHDYDSAQYVLERFDAGQKELLGSIMEKAAQCCRIWVTQGIQQSMSIYNRAASSSGGRAAEAHQESEKNE